MPALIACLLLAFSQPASAHSAPSHGSGFGWTFDPLVVGLVAVSAMLYVSGSCRLWARAGIGHGVTIRQFVAYASGWLLLAGALLSPLHELGEHVFTFHMIEHELVMAAAAPLLVLARPLAAFMWALPHSWRIRLARTATGPATRLIWERISSMTAGTVAHGAAIWAWHYPAFFEAALQSEMLHRLQHASFLVTALLFWHALRRGGAPGRAVWHLFVTMIHMSVLGALIALAPRLMYRMQTVDAAMFGMTPLEDQQLAGVVMWIPAGTVYAGAALLFAAFWIRKAGRSSYAPLGS
jgi:putative membrane protein